MFKCWRVWQNRGNLTLLYERHYGRFFLVFNVDLKNGYCFYIRFPSGIGDIA